MIKTQTYRLTRIRPGKRKALYGLLSHLTYLRCEAVFYARRKWKEEGTCVRFFDLCYELTRTRQSCVGWAKYAVATQRSILKRVADGYQRLYNKQGKRPRLHKRVRSFEGISLVKRSGACYAIHVKGVGTLRFKDVRGIVESCTVMRWRIVSHPLGSGFDVQLIYDDGMEMPAPDTRPLTGIDWGLKSVATLSNGTQYKPEVQCDKRLRPLSRSLSKAKRSSMSRGKKKRARAREARRMAIRRHNALHRVTTDIIQGHSANLALETLIVINLMAKGGARKTGLNRSFAEKSLGKMRTMLVQKAERANGQVYRVRAAFTSQDCSQCGVRKSDLTLRDRIYRCAVCGMTLDRDVNAARNILAAGLRQRGWGNSLGAGKDGTLAGTAAKSSDSVSACTA